MVFPGQFPNLSPPFHGLEPILPRSWQALKDRFGFASERDYLKHILEAHDGEARLIGDGDDWTPFPVSDGVDVSNPCFWHHQFAKIERRAIGCMKDNTDSGESTLSRHGRSSG